MTAHKLVIKCGNFAVLVDFHVVAQDSSKDTAWFSDQKREEVCLLLKDTVESRVKQYLKARKWHSQRKQMEYAEANSLSLKADGFHVAAYFVKRWTNLRCIGGQQNSAYRGSKQGKGQRQRKVQNLKQEKHKMTLFSAIFAAKVTSEPVYQLLEEFTQMFEPNVKMKISPDPVPSSSPILSSCTAGT